jgi:hypothetical protein
MYDSDYVLSKGVLGSKETVTSPTALDNASAVTCQRPKGARPGYVATVDKKFPSSEDPMGQSRYWEPKEIRLTASKGADGIRLAFSHDHYDATYHSSDGLAQGVYSLGDEVVHDKPGSWSGRFNNYKGLFPGRARWEGGEPPIGNTRYDFEADITAQAAERIAEGEAQHVADFDYAWTISAGVIEAQIPGGPYVDEETAIGRLVDDLIKADRRYLIPATPEDLGQWGKRIINVYRDLCGMSQQRDRIRDGVRSGHVPSGYVFSWSGYKIKLRFEFQPRDEGSDVYIRPKDLGDAFIAPSFAAYRTPASGFPAGTKVRLAPGVSAHFQVADVFLAANPNAMNLSIGAEEVAALLAGPGGVVMSEPGIKANEVWVQVTLSRGSEFFEVMGSETGFVDVPVSQLTRQ